MPANCCKEFWQKIPDDEPVFTLAARDSLAPGIIRKWIESARSQGVNADKIDSVIKHLESFTDFQALNPHRVKPPD